VPLPFDFRLTVQKPAGWHWGTPHEIYDEGVLYTAVRLPGVAKAVGLKVWEERPPGRSHFSVVRVETAGARLGEAALAKLLAMLDLGLGVDDDLRGFYRLEKTDPLVAKLKKDLYGLRMGFLVDILERCLLAITLQMAPMKRSTAMRDCLIGRYGETARVDGRKIAFWPSAGAIMATPVEELQRNCALGYRAKAVHAVAESIQAGFPDIVELSRLEDEELNRKLATLYGIGDYSAQIVSPRRGFPLDVWSARIFYEILYGTTPEHPRSLIKELDAEADRRWGAYKQHVFVYVLNDLPNLLASYPITKLS
jgi:3-methyladenine DNA glycosylase/8-oxoguanine DNA glycosylase